jgi:hypothetical protein
MTPKEKAKELVDKFRQQTDGIAGYNYDNVNKQCALIAVDEILNSNPHIYIEIGGSDCRGDWSYKEAQSNQLYWKEVKQEIEKL